MRRAQQRKSVRGHSLRLLWPTCHCTCNWSPGTPYHQYQHTTCSPPRTSIKSAAARSINNTACPHPPPVLPSPTPQFVPLTRRPSPRFQPFLIPTKVPQDFVRSLWISYMAIYLCKMKWSRPLARPSSKVRKLRFGLIQLYSMLHVPLSLYMSFSPSFSTHQPPVTVNSNTAVSISM